jgi:signal transduction histidine kinase/CheY-like chemotaxis protein
MKSGAADYVMKDRLARLVPAVTRAVDAARQRRERRRLEQQLAEAQKLEAVGRLAGGVAHDFNNVLTAILGSTELLLLDSAPGVPVREELDIIRDAATRAQDLIRQLLAFSARQVLRPVVVDLNHLVASVGKMLRRLISEDIRLTTEPARELGAVRADPGQLEQVLLNLAVNARDAMPDGGHLTIRTFNAEVGGQPDRLPDDPEPAVDRVPPGRYVVLEFSDTGVGMTAEIQGRIFEPFFTTKPQGKGTGLGLATVYGIVRQSGGHVAVRSAPGAGTTFRLYLPQVDEAIAPATGPTPVTAPAGGSETVLLAEDDQLVRLLTRRILEQAGYDVLVAGGGAEALELARRHEGPIDLLLTDVVMPEMGGRDLTRRLAEVRPGVPVLYMTGYSDDAIARHGVLDPGTALIQKPFTPAALARKVRQVLDRSPEAEP